MIFLLLGIVSGFRHVFREAKRMQERRAGSEGMDTGMSRAIEGFLYRRGFRVAGARRLVVIQVAVAAVPASRVWSWGGPGPPPCILPWVRSWPP
jgi:hypothetical protein